MYPNNYGGARDKKYFNILVLKINEILKAQHILTFKLIENIDSTTVYKAFTAEPIWQMMKSKK